MYLYTPPYIYIYIYICACVSECVDVKLATTLRCREWRYSNSWIAPIFP